MAVELPILDATETAYKPEGSTKYIQRVAKNRRMAQDFALQIGETVYLVDLTSTNQWTQFSNTVETLTNAVIVQYSTIAEVEAIYRAVRDSRLYFYIFTSEKIYNDALMSRLIDTEIALAARYPDVKQTYEFVASVLVSDKSYVTGGGATLVFSR